MPGSYLWCSIATYQERNRATGMESIPYKIECAWGGESAPAMAEGRSAGLDINASSRLDPRAIQFVPVAIQRLRALMSSQTVLDKRLQASEFIRDRMSDGSFTIKGLQRAVARY